MAYRLSKPLIDMENTCTNDSSLYLLKCVIFALFVCWLCKQLFGNKKESFTETEQKYNDKNLIKILTSNCKPEYCNMYSWGDKPEIPEGYSMSNFSTNQGCCVIPDKLKNYIYLTRGGNA